FTVGIIGNRLNEIDKSFFLNLSLPLNATISRGQGICTILNDDPLPKLSINDVSVVEGNSGTVEAVFTVSLSEVSGQVVTVNFLTSNGNAIAGKDYVPNSGTLTFPEETATQTITVLVNGDLLNEVNETFSVKL